MPLTPEHIEARLHGVGGSDLPAILHEFLAAAGDTVYGCPRALWLEKRRIPPDYEFKVTGAIKRGEALEPLIAGIYSRETGQKVRKLQHQVSKDRPWEMVSIDRQIIGDPRGPGILECKSVGRERWYQIKSKGLPLSFVIQVQWGFRVLREHYIWGIDAVLWPDGWEYHFYDVDRDEKLIVMIAKEVDAFWVRVVNNDPPPRLKWSDKRCQNCRWRTSCQGNDLKEAVKGIEFFEEEATDEALSPLVAQRMELKDIIEEADARKTDVENEIKNAMNAHKRSIVVAGGHKITWIQQDDTLIIDSDKIKKAYSETWEKEYSKLRKGARPLCFYPI